ncbi:MAG: NAD(P)/FAD-dependent oxidoreductase [Pseudomonadota bacterium]
MSKAKNISDVAIIGAGPTGLFAIFECGMMGLSVQVIDSLPEIGGQCTALYPDKPIYDIPAYPEIPAAQLIENLEKQAAPFKPKYHLNQQVISIKQQSGYWHLKTSHDQEIQSKCIIIAAGPGAFGPNRPPLEGIEAYENQSIFYMVRDPNSFKDKNILIAGGGDSAVDWAINLQPIAKSVRLLHRRDKFRAMPENVQKIYEIHEKKQIEILTPYQLHALNGQDGQLESVEIKNKEGQIETVNVDVLLPFYGLSNDLGPILEWGLNIDKNHITVDPVTARTNIDKIYAIGDIAAYTNKKKLIVTGFSEGAFAAYDIRRTLYPDEAEHFEYSTSKGLPS